MKLIVGLGNPGRQYETTRHNVGFMVVQQLGKQARGRWQFRLHPAFACRSAGPVTLILPHTMMNASGLAMRAAATRWRVAPEEILIVCDDVNLPLGTLRLRDAGSAGGHHGLASCLDALGTEAVPRLRVGVGVEPLPMDLTDFVLAEFRQEEQRLLGPALERAVEACAVWARDGIQAAMNRANPRSQEGRA